MSDLEATARLRAIAAVTDTAIGGLNVDDLLVELLGRIVELLHADTAAVLLLDHSGQLVARAAYGIEEEVRQGVRIPLGAGFAGRIATERRPVRLEQVDRATVWNPMLSEKGIRKMLGVPLEAGPTLLGVLHVGRVADTPFTDADAGLLQLVGARVAAAIQARELEIERAAGSVVQRSLLPSALPDCEGVEFATRFVPAEEGGVGGDWYDAFVVAPGELWVMAGDVGGHGLEAAITMGRLRAALRSYALDGNGPGKVLALADRKFQFFDPGQIATVVCALFNPASGHMQLAAAGHPPPVIAYPGHAARFVHLHGCPPLGVTECDPAPVTIELPTGAVLLLYTDGLIERRREPLQAGLDRLVSVVAAEHPEDVCRRVMATLVGREKPRDDIAVVALRRTS